MMKSFEEFQTFGKDGFEAYVASSSALTKGMQAIAQETTEFSRKSFEKSTAAFEKASAVKSIDKVLEVQQAFADMDVVALPGGADADLANLVDRRQRLLIHGASVRRSS